MGFKWVPIYNGIFAILGVAMITPEVSNAEPPTSIFGIYSGAGCHELTKTDACLPTTLRDRVILRQNKQNDAMVSIKIIFDGGHSCSISGEATWSDGIFKLRAEGLEPDKPCMLQLRVSKNRLDLLDEGGFCREVYCGTRGAFDGARFSRALKDKPIR